MFKDKRIISYTRDSQELLLAKDVFSYRISENKNPDTKEINVYVLPLCLPAHWTANLERCLTKL